MDLKIQFRHVNFKVSFVFSMALMRLCIFVSYCNDNNFL